MDRLRAIDRPPIATYLIALAFLIVVVGGAVVAIVNPDELTAGEYFGAIAITALGLGLLAIGRGINEYGKQDAGARALETAHRRGERFRPVDPEADMPPPPPELELRPRARP